MNKYMKWFISLRSQCSVIIVTVLCYVDETLISEIIEALNHLTKIKSLDKKTHKKMKLHKSNSRGKNR